MSRPNGLPQWSQTVSTHCPHLSRPQAEVLALCSYGMTLAHACAITTITVPLAPLFGQAESTLLRRLREWYYSAADKRAGTREVEVSTCFAPRLALDASTLSDPFTVLAISVVYRGCALPVAWKLVQTHTKGAWQPHWTVPVLMSAPRLRPHAFAMRRLGPGQTERPMRLCFGLPLSMKQSITPRLDANHAQLSRKLLKRSRETGRGTFAQEGA